SLRVPLKDNGYLNTGPNRRSSNVIIRRPNRLSPNEAWNLEPVLYLPIATAGAVGNNELSDGSTTGPFTGEGPVVAGEQRSNGRDLVVEMDWFGCLMPQTDSLRYLAGDAVTDAGTGSSPVGSAPVGPDVVNEVVNDVVHGDEGLANFNHIATAKRAPRE